MYAHQPTLALIIVVRFLFEINQETGEFSAFQACIPIVCGGPETIAHTTVSSGVVSFPNSAEYHCDEGFTTSGVAGASTTFRKSCTDSGHLLTLTIGATVATCRPVICGTPPSARAYRL